LTTSAAETAKRVLVVCNDADYFLRHRLPVVTHLVSIGVDVAVMTGGEPIPRDRIAGWSYVHTPIERFSLDPVRDCVLWLRTFKSVLTLKPDAVHLITMKPAVFSGLAAVAARRLCGRPRRILITIPGLGRMMSGQPDGQRIGLRLARALTERTVRFLAARSGVHFTFETGFDRESWIARGLVTAAGSTVVEGAGVDAQRFFPLSDERQPGAIKVLFASRLLKAKGIDIFVDVARRLAARTDVQFLVAGIFSEQDPDAVSPARLQQEKAIRFLGEVSDMPALLRNCDIVCLPTRYGEGIPRILIEAAATGLASIATDIPGCREAIKDGVTGTLVPDAEMDTASAVHDALLAYLSNPELIRTHGEAAYRLFKSRNFGESQVAARFQELLGYADLKV
jgi:glycosyltransferase involved in cell wall biosynthesis